MRAQTIHLLTCLISWYEFCRWLNKPEIQLPNPSKFVCLIILKRNKYLLIFCRRLHSNFEFQSSIAYWGLIKSMSFCSKKRGSFDERLSYKVPSIIGLQCIGKICFPFGGLRHSNEISISLNRCWITHNLIVKPTTVTFQNAILYLARIKCSPMNRRMSTAKFKYHNKYLNFLFEREMDIKWFAHRKLTSPIFRDTK